MKALLSATLVLALVAPAGASLFRESRGPTVESVAVPKASVEAWDPQVPGHQVLPPGAAQRSPMDVPEEGVNYVLGQNIQYPAPGSQNRMLGPLCYFNTRKVVAGDDEVFVAGWESGSENDNEIMVTMWDAFFGLWSSPLPISQSITDAGRLDLVRGPDGTIHAAWHQNYQQGVSTYEIFYSRLGPGEFNWSPPVRVSRADAVESNFPNVGVDASGRVTVRWAELLRDAAGGILEYRGYATNSSLDNGLTWSESNIVTATTFGQRLYGAMCVDPVSGDVYLFDYDETADPADQYDDIIAFYYQRSSNTWFGPEIVVYGGGPNEPLHAALYPSATVGPDGTVYLLFSKTTNADPGYIWVDNLVGQPVSAQLFLVKGTYGNWSEPVAIYPGHDGVFEGYEGVYPDSTWLQFCSFAQIGVDANNKLYIATRAYEYYNGDYLTGFGDMNSSLGGGMWRPEEWIACKDQARGSEWVWTRGSNINLRPDSIGVKYSKVPEWMPTSCAVAVWDESYNGTRPQKVMFVRLTDFTSPGPLTNIRVSRPVENGPVTFTWTNPPDEDLAGIRVIRTRTGKAHLVGLRRGLIPLSSEGQWMYDPDDDVVILEPDSLTGQLPTEWVDEAAPAGTVYYTFVPFDVNLHHLYPIPDEACVKVDPVVVRADEAALPAQLCLESVDPNPASSAVVVRYALAAEGLVRIAVYDLAGRHVKTLAEGVAQPGRGSARWDLRDAQGKAVSSGTYLIRVEQGSLTASRHVVVVR